MNTELVAFGVLTFAFAVSLLWVARRLYPRLDLSPDAIDTIRLLTALIVAILVLTGIGLVLIGALS